MSEGGISPLIVKYEKSLEEDPRSRVFAPLAEAYRKVGLIDNAFKVLKKGLRYNPDYLFGYIALAQCYFDRGEYALVFSTLRPLISKNRDNIKVQKLFAEGAYLTGYKEEALDAYKYLLYLNPKDQEVIKKVTELEAELEEVTVQTTKEEIKFDVDRIDVSPLNDQEIDEWIQVDLARLKEDEDVDEEDSWTVELHDQEKTEERNVERVQESDGTPVITHTLVDLYIQQGYKEKAIEILEKILEIQPDNASSREKLASLKELSFDEDIEETTEEKSDEGNSDGHENLMAAFDKTLGPQEVIDVGLQVFDDFAKELRERASRINHE